MEAFQPSGAAFVDFQGAFGVDHALLQTTLRFCGVEAK